MNSFRAAVGSVLVCAVLSGCNLDFQAIQSASYATYEKGSPSKPTALSPAQVQQLSTWLASHRSGWSRSIVAYSPKILVQATHANGDVSGIDVWPSQVSAYGTFGQYERTLTESEYSAIISLLRPNGG